MTTALAEPCAGYQLALMGADVVRLETLGSGDLTRKLGASTQPSSGGLGISFSTQNSEKFSITVDLTFDGGREIFVQLAAGADTEAPTSTPRCSTRRPPRRRGWSRTTSSTVANQYR
ncbi:CoA transferase [Rhodococcus sp. Rp3]|uniref:CoA transferase n=1 Tax=Rhodococcus sp. Rp3 TaxID=2807635 RepID=UPI003FA70B52|nr:CoA transferase [Rhodococcus sp. Rp3]